MTPTCDNCRHGEYHGYPPETSPEWEVGTVYFWCPVRESHERPTSCRKWMLGKPRHYDKRGVQMKAVER